MTNECIWCIAKRIHLSSNADTVSGVLISSRFQGMNPEKAEYPHLTNPFCEGQIKIVRNEIERFVNILQRVGDSTK
jgi:hypothetical protein